MAKNAFTSKTVICSTAASASGLLMLVMGFLTDPATVRAAGEYAERNGHSDLSRILKDYVLPALVGVAGIGGILGRFSVGDLYTPRGLPGRNKEDFASELTLREVMQTALEAKNAALAANNADRIGQVADLITNLQQRLESPVAEVAPVEEPSAFPGAATGEPGWTRQLPNWIERPAHHNDVLEGY